MTAPVRLIAFYLPQYHPIPENDGWWGKGFTEWRNVIQAKPLFRGHYQPHVPGELGYYDLRVPEVRAAQAELARAYGIYGFCYYHYWFKGRRLLERPFNEVLTSGQPDLPFCLCWVNESWRRAWDGRSGEYLLQQEYSASDDRAQIQWLARAFKDPRYIRVGEKPLFLIYRASNIPDPLATTSTWRQEARKLGIGEIYLCRVESFSDEHDDPTLLGFDAAVEFQPDWTNIGEPLRRTEYWRRLRQLGLSDKVYSENRIYDYATVATRMMQKPRAPYTRFPCVMPSWDNTARRKTEAVIFKGATPSLYENWLKATIAKFKPPTPDENLIFVNAWNEWGEGNHLEPDQRNGRAYLESTRRALEYANTKTSESRS